MATSRAEDVLREIERTAARRFLPIIGPHRGRILEEVIRKNRPRSVLEIGTNVGYSTILMGKELGGDAGIITIEIHPDEAKTAEENIRRVEIQPTVEVLVGDAMRILSGLQGEFDLVFIDADKGEYMEYLRLIEGKLHRGSVLVADNAGLFAHQMRDYLDYVRHSGKYRSRYIPSDGDGVEVSTKL